MFIAVDFDGTIAEHKFPKIGEAVPGAFEWMKKFQEAGAQLILWTCRTNDTEWGDTLDEAVQFCNDNGIIFLGVNCNPQQDFFGSPKIFAHVYIDDMAYGCPLIYNEDGRPHVDWDEIGPPILSMIKFHSRLK